MFRDVLEDAAHRLDAAVGSPEEALLQVPVGNNGTLLGPSPPPVTPPVPPVPPLRCQAQSGKVFVFDCLIPNSKKARGSIPDPRVLGSVPNVRRLTPIPSSLKLLLTGHRESKTWGRSATWSSDAWKFASGVA